VKRLLPLAGLMLLATGCATHYYRVQGDTLAIYLDKPKARKVTFACSLDDFKPPRRPQGRRPLGGLRSGARTVPLFLCAGRRTLPAALRSQGK
jgi:hypothetical protein